MRAVLRFACGTESGLQARPPLFVLLLILFFGRSLLPQTALNFPELPFSPSADVSFPKFSNPRTAIEMSERRILRLGSLKDAAQFQEHLRSLQITIPCDSEISRTAESPLRKPLVRGEIKIGNRIAVQPMEGWDGTADGNPSDPTVRRWQRFARSGAKLIWGGEAVAVCQEGRANPNQLLAAPQTRAGLEGLRAALLAEHRRVSGSHEDLLIGLQLTHSGRYSCPNQKGRPEPRILYHHPILDRRLNLSPDYPLLTDAEIEGLIEEFHRAARMASELGFDFVDIKHCHGYLGHEFLSAH